MCHHHPIALLIGMHCPYLDEDPIFKWFRKELHHLMKVVVLK